MTLDIERAVQNHGNAWTGLGELRRLLADPETTTAELVRCAATIQAAAKALNLAKGAVYDLLRDRADASRKREGTKWRAPVSGVADAYLPEGDPEPYVTDNEALASWLREDKGAYGRCVVISHEVHVRNHGVALAALTDLRQALDAIDAERVIHDPGGLLETCRSLERQLEGETTETVDIAALRLIWSRTDDTGLPVTEHGERVPHIAMTKPEPGALTVRPNKAHTARLVTRFTQTLGLEAPDGA
jgi:hypothetical protein